MELRPISLSMASSAVGAISSSPSATTLLITTHRVTWRIVSKSTVVHTKMGHVLGVIFRVAVDMKYHIHIHIHIHRCLSCVHVYAVSNYKKHSCFLLSTGSIFTAFMTKHNMKKHTQVRSVLCYRVSVQKKSQNSHGFISALSPYPALQRHIRQLHPVQFPSSTPPH